MPLPLAQQVLLRSLDGGVREVALHDRTIVRSSVRPDDATANLVLLHGPVTDAGLLEACEDADARFVGASRVVAPLAEGDERHDADVVAALRGRTDRQVVVQHVVAPRDAADWAADVPARDDVALAAPGDQRAWHGLQVLLRHEVPGEDRGAGDDVLAARVADRRDLLATGRARVLLARRFGTPVAAGVLVWDPRVDVGPDHAGLAVVTDLVTHPAHRGLGLGRQVAATLVATHLAQFPAARTAAVVPVAPPVGGGWDRLARLVAVG